MGLFNRGTRQPDKVQTNGASPEAEEEPMAFTPDDELPPAEEMENAVQSSAESESARAEPTSEPAAERGA